MRGRRLLIIDDEPGVRSSLALLLTDEGFVVDTAADADTDADTDASDIGVVWESSVNGLLRDANADPSGTSVFQTAALMVGEHIISVTATDPDGNTTFEQVDIRINDLPNAPSLSQAQD